MKKSELKELIKNRIRETLYAGAASLGRAKADPDYSKLSPADKMNVDNTLKKQGAVELEEMARRASTFKVADDFREKASTIKTGGPISPKKLEDVLNFLETQKETTGPAIAAAVGFEGKMPRIYPIYAELINKGALIPTEKEKVVDVPDTPENKKIQKVLEPKKKAEPKGKPVVLNPVAKEAANFLIDNSRLISSIINSFKDSRSRIGSLRVEPLGEATGDLSTADLRKALEKSKESSATRFDTKLDELVTKLKDLDPAVQERILSSLDFKFNSVGAGSISKALSKKLGVEIKPLDNNSVSTEKDLEKISAKDAGVDDEDIEIEDIDDELMEYSGVEDVDNDEDDFREYDSVYERMQKLMNYKG